MRVIILHSDVGSCASADEQDVLTQVESVSAALKNLGHEALPMPLCLDLDAAARRFREAACDLVFNLVETVGGQGRLIHLAPALLDFMRIPYTGARTEATFLSSNKLAAKKLLHAHRLRTPPWCTLRDSSAAGPCPAGSPFIVKSVWEHASVGLEEDSVVCPQDADALRGEIRKSPRATGCRCVRRTLHRRTRVQSLYSCWQRWSRGPPAGGNRIHRIRNKQASPRRLQGQVGRRVLRISSHAPALRLRAA